MSIEPHEPPKEIWERRKLGIELRQKYELYFISLAFTLAGLSVQTAPHGGPRWQATLEIFGWLLLLSTGVLGMWRVGKLWLRELGVAQYQESQWSTPSTRLATELDAMEKSIRRFGKIQFGVFFAGFSFVMASRASVLLCP
jgi:hypothetical protein